MNRRLPDEDMMDEIASIKPKQSQNNPIPLRVEQRKEENKRRVIDEKEKDFYANKRPRNSGGCRKKVDGAESQDIFNDIYNLTVEKTPKKSNGFPIIDTNDIYLQSGEKCYFISNATLIDRKLERDYVTTRAGVAGQLIFEGDFYTKNYTRRKLVGEHVDQSSYTGTLYVTNKRTIFIEKYKGFDKKHTTISAIIPYADGLEIQYGSKTYALMLERANELYELYEMLH
jgi:hypothetical protein